MVRQVSREPRAESKDSMGQIYGRGVSPNTRFTNNDENSSPQPCGLFYLWRCRCRIQVWNLKRKEKRPDCPASRWGIVWDVRMNLYGCTNLDSVLLHPQFARPFSEPSTDWLRIEEWK